MIAYHGTAVQGLNLLTPFANPYSNLSYPCVYLSADKALASIYIWNRPFKWMTFEIREDGMPVYNESFQDGLKTFYGGLKGCIYTCEGDFLYDEKTTIRCAVVSKEPVPILETDLVEDAYERILQFERDGRLIINHYEDLTDAQRQRDRRMVRAAIERCRQQKEPGPMNDFIRETFPDIWEESLTDIAKGE